MSRGPWIDPTYRADPEVLRGSLETDTAIVGAGIAGASLAWCLTQAGVDAVLVDADRAGHGASGRSAGFVLADGAESYAVIARTHGAEVARALRDLGTSGRTTIRSFSETADIGYERAGSLRLAEDRSEMSDLQRTAEALGGSLRCVECPDLPPPWCDDKRFVGGLIDPDDAIVDPVRLVNALIDEVRSTARVFEQSPVVQVQSGEGQPIVYTEDGHVVARVVVLCTNAWTRRLLPSVGPIQPVRAQALEATVEPCPDWPMAVYARRGQDYWRGIGGGRVLLGGRRDVGGRAENVDVDEPTAPVQSALDKLLRSLLPKGSEIMVSRRWAGLMGFTPDGLPVAGTVPGHAGVYALCGFNGHGISWAPGLAHRLAAALAGEASALPACFSPSRFAYPAR